MKTVPRGWKLTTLGSVRSVRGQSINPSRFPGDQFELYSIPAHPTGNPEVVLGSEIGSAKQIVTPGTVLLGKINPRINRVWVVGNSKSGRSIASTEWIPFAPNSDVVPQYLAYYLRQNEVRDFLAHNVSGVGGSLMRVRPAVTDKFPFSIPPIDDQRAIVLAIESHFSRLDAITVMLERVQRNLKRYRASVLKAAIEGRLLSKEAGSEGHEYRNPESATELLDRALTERRSLWGGIGKQGKYQDPVPPDVAELPELPTGWCWASLDQLLVSPLTNGRSVPTADTGFPVLRLTALKDGGVDLRQSKIGDWTAAEATAYLVREGDFMVARGNGSIRRVGRGSLVGHVPHPVAFPDTLIRVRVSSHVFLPRLLSLFWNSQVVRTHLERAAKTTAGIFKLNQADLARIPLPLPPIAEQHRLLHHIERVLTIADAVQVSIDRDVTRVRGLKDRVLTAAFRGELV